MKVLLVDRDEMAAQLIKSKLEPLGHDVVVEPVKNNAAALLAGEPYDLVFVDPSPLNDARPLALEMRRAANHYSYMILTKPGATTEDAIKIGANDALAKPLDVGALDAKLYNAMHLTNLVRRIGDDSEDFPSAGGVIAKSAFNQLFLSAIDRADRYGERTFVLFITMSNYDQILELDGPYAADYAAAKLSQYLVHLRRQSDIIAQTAKYEYALLLQRPVYETEPIEAAGRFAQSLSQCNEIESTGSVAVEITLDLVDLPIGSSVVKKVITPGKSVSDSQD